MNNKLMALVAVLAILAVGFLVYAVATKDKANKREELPNDLVWS